MYSGIFQLSSFEFERLLKNCLKIFNTTIQVIFFNLHEWYIDKWAASCEKAASTALFTVLKVTGD
jgi:hypothetical protein